MVLHIICGAGEPWREGVAGNGEAYSGGDGRMHVLFISDGDGKYGASQSMKQLIGGLLEYCGDIEISVVLPARVRTAGYYRELGCRTYRVMYEPFCQSIMEEKWKMPFKFIIRGTEYLVGRCCGVPSLCRKMDMGTVDIIHSNSSREDLGSMLALKYNKPLVWHIREMGDGCYSYRKGSIKLMNRAAAEFIAVSDAVKSHWAGKGLDGKRIHKIYDGVAEEGHKKKYLRDADRKIRFLMVGRISQAKGQDQVIRALGLLKEEQKKKVWLDFVGGCNGAYRETLARMVKEYGLSPSVRFLGYQNDFGKNIRKYDCGIMCSLTEGFGRVTAEYMMAGLPVIASDIPTNRELVFGNGNGLLYQCGNVLDLKEKIAWLLDHPYLLEQMGKKAREHALSHYTVKLNAELIYREYMEIMKGRSGKGL